VIFSRAPLLQHKLCAIRPTESQSRHTGAFNFELPKFTDCRATIQKVEKVDDNTLATVKKS
jgi:hypothetical protein